MKNTHNFPGEEYNPDRFNVLKNYVKPNTIKFLGEPYSQIG